MISKQKLTPKKYLHSKEACEFLGIHKDTLRRYRWKGKLKSTIDKANDYHLYKVDDLLRIKPEIEKNRKRQVA